MAGLESLLEDADSQVRISAAEAIVLLAPEARTPIPVLIRAIDDTDPEIRSCAATILEQIDPSELKKKTPDPLTTLGASNEVSTNQELAANLSSPSRESGSAGNASTPALSVSSSERLWRIPSLLHLGTLEPRVLHERLIRLWVPVPCTLSTGSDSLSVRPSRLARGPHEVVLNVEPHLRSGRFEERLLLRSPSQTRSIIIQYEMVEGSRPEPRTPSARAVIWQPMDWNRIVYDTRMKDLARLRERSSQSDQTGLYGTPRACSKTAARHILPAARLPDVADLTTPLKIHSTRPSGIRPNCCRIVWRDPVLRGRQVRSLRRLAEVSPLPPVALRAASGSTASCRLPCLVC